MRIFSRPLTKRKAAVFTALIFSLLFGVSQASGETAGTVAYTGAATTFLWIAVILIAAKISSLVEWVGQPSVLGELLIGIILGNLALVGLHIFEPIKTNEIIGFLAELGVVVLLFQIGLESNLNKMRSVGVNAFLVAIIGVVLPFIIGAYLGPYILPGFSSNAYLFLGAALTATSVGITARVFKDLGMLQTKEAQIVLGAAVIDDILGLVILAVVSAIVTIGAITLGTIGWILAKAFLFLAIAIFLGQVFADNIGALLSKINTSIGMKFTLALSFGLILAFVAEKIGLAPIVGAFAAGLILDPVHFRYFKNPHIVDEIRECMENSTDKICKERVESTIESHARKHIEDIIEPVGLLLVPIFFVVTGMAVNLTVLFNGPIILVALGITVVAFLGKILSGLAAGPGVNKSIIGWGMVPRGEVGLIFAAIGRSLGVVGEELFSVIVIVVLLTTLFTPPILTHLLKQERPKNAEETSSPTPAINHIGN